MYAFQAIRQVARSLNSCYIYTLINNRYLFVCLFVCLLFVCCLFVCLFVCCLFVVCLFVCLLFVCCLFVCLFVCLLFVCLFVCCLFVCCCCLPATTRVMLLSDMFKLSAQLRLQIQR